MDAEPGAPPASGAAVEREQIVDTWGRPSVASSPFAVGLCRSDL